MSMMIPNLSAEMSEAMKKIAAQGENERYWHIQRMEAIWTGQRYILEGRPSFWSADIPVRLRAPAVQSHLPMVAGTRLAHMIFGHRSFPDMKVAGGGFGTALTPADVDALQALLLEIVKTCKLSIKARDYLIEGLKTGTSVCLTSLKGGRPSIKILPAKWCTPQIDMMGAVQHLVIQYKIPSATPGQYMWYRREIGEGLDRVWDPQPVEGKEPEWEKITPASEDPIEFVNVVWTRCLPSTVEDDHSIDGHALAEGLEDEIEALDLQMSLHHRNAIYNGDPVTVRTMAPEESVPAPMAPQGPIGGAFSWFASKGSGQSMFGGGQATKKGPGNIWNLPNGGSAEILESSGAGAKIIEGAMASLRRVVTDALGVVMADPGELGSGDLSARALTLLFGPMIDTADNLRDSYGDALVEILGQLLRHCAGPNASALGVHLPAWEAARPALAKLWATSTDEGRVWINPMVEISWGAYFEQTWEEVSAAVEAATKATGNKAVMSRKRAITLLTKLTGVTDVEEEYANLQADESGATGTGPGTF